MAARKVTIAQSRRNLGRPLSELAGLRVRTFTFKDDPNHTETYGVIAQEAEVVAPELVVTDASTTMKKVRYGEVQWLMLSALQKLIAKVSDLATTVASFADHFTTRELTFTRATGDDLTVNHLHAGEACLPKIDGSEVCITGDQLAALLSQSAAAALPNPSPNPAASAPANQFPNPSPDAEVPADAASLTPPVIRINGANPAHINIGDVYNDLGAAITGPQADLNLGIKTFLNGALVSDIVIDTTQPATDTIDYVATDQNGLTSTSTRTVIIEVLQTPVASSSSTTTQ